MIRAVLDTNVVVSGIIKGESPPGRVLEALFQGRFISVTSLFLLAEVVRVLNYPKISRKYHISRRDADSIVTSLALLSDLIRVSHVSWRATRDPGDEPFLACALQGRGDYVVTGDRDLLVLNSFRGVEIVTPEAFLKRLKD